MEGGGAERVAALLASAWAERGDEVVLMPTFSRGGGCAYPLSPKVRLRYLSEIAGTNLGKVARLRELRHFIRGDRPDVIVSFLTNVNVAAILASAGLGIPVIASERVYPPLAIGTLTTSYRILRQLSYPFAAALVGQTDPAAQWLRRRSFGVDVAVIPNPVSLPLPASEPTVAPDSLIPSDRRILLWVGRFVDQKRPALMVEAFRRVASSLPDWDLVMLGEGPLRPAIEAAADRPELRGRLHLPGFAGNLADWYRRAGLFVMTSSFEGFPNTLLEAMAHGAPSIAFDILTGPRELSDDGRRLILLADQDQAGSLSVAIADLASKPDLLRRLGEAASEVVSDYSEDAILVKWDALFAACRPPST